MGTASKDVAFQRGGQWARPTKTEISESEAVYPSDIGLSRSNVRRFIDSFGSNANPVKSNTSARPQQMELSQKQQLMTLLRGQGVKGATTATSGITTNAT
jgi:hypothetical protein